MSEKCMQRYEDVKNIDTTTFEGAKKVLLCGVEGELRRSLEGLMNVYEKQGKTVEEAISKIGDLLHKS